MNNVVLVRSNVGWTERSDLSSISTVGRIEAVLTLGAVSSAEEADRQGDAQLAEFAGLRVQTDIGIAPKGGDVPFDDFGVGDTVTIDGVDPHRVLGIAVTEDRQNGRVIYTPTLNANVILNENDRIFNALRKMLLGTGSGRFTAAQPFLPIARPAGLVPLPEVALMYLETFTGADGVLGVTTTDLPWNAESGAEPEVLGNQASGFTNGYARAEVDTSTADMFVECDWTFVTSGGNDLYLFARAGNAGGIFSDDTVMFYVSPVGGTTYVQIANWSGSGTGTDDTISTDASATWRLEVVGNQATAFKDGAQILTCDISDFAPSPAGTRAGFAMDSGATVTPTPTTISESFNTSNGTTIGPDLTWSKSSFASGGTAGGVIDGNAFAVVGNPDADKFGQCHISTTPSLGSFLGTGSRSVSATITAKSALGTGGGQVDYTMFRLYFGSVVMQIDNNGGGGATRCQIQSSGPNSGFATAAFGVGDVLTLEIDGSNNAVAKVNGSTVQTLSGATGGSGSVGCYIEVSCTSQASFTADAQDKLDSFTASGTVDVSTYEAAVDNWQVGDM